MKNRGRKPIYTGNLKRHIAGIIRKNACISRAMFALATEGISISRDTLIKIAKECNIKTRSRAHDSKTKRHAISVVRRHGITHGRSALVAEGISISPVTLGRFAAEAGIKLFRGRPRKVKND